MSYLPFTISDTLKERLRASETKATTAVQLAAAIPQPEVQTQASPSPQMTVIPYPLEIITSGAVGYWRLGPYMVAGLDYVPIQGFYPVFIPGTYYGYLLPLVGTIGGDITYVTGVDSSTPSDNAAAFAAGAGAIITYFPLAGYESYFPGSLDVAVGADFTWEFWIRTSQDPASPVRILEQASAGVFPYRIQLVPGGLIRASRSDGTLIATVNSAQAVNNNAWHYVAVYKSGASFGVAIDSNTAVTTTDTLVASTTLTVDGALAGDGFVGSLDELALYKVALAPAARARRPLAAAGSQVPI